MCRCSACWVQAQQSALCALCMPRIEYGADALPNAEVAPETAVQYQMWDSMYFAFQTSDGEAFHQAVCDCCSLFLDRPCCLARSFFSNGVGVCLCVCVCALCLSDGAGLWWVTASVERILDFSNLLNCRNLSDNMAVVAVSPPYIRPVTSDAQQVILPFSAAMGQYRVVLTVADKANNTARFFSNCVVVRRV